MGIVSVQICNVKMDRALLSGTLREKLCRFFWQLNQRLFFIGSRTVGERPDRTLSEWYQRESQQGLSENRQSEYYVARAGEADGADRSNFPLTAQPKSQHWQGLHHV